MKAQELSPREASRQIDEFHVVDVREADEFVGPLGHIPGARLLPFGRIETEAHELPRDRALLIACRSGRRSAMACELLATLGVSSTMNLSGGMIAWNDSQLPVAGRSPGSER